MAASRQIDITYVPADCGSVIPGKSKAPQAFRDVGLVQKLRAAGLDVAEHHALEEPAVYSAVAFEPGHIRNEALNVRVYKRVRESLVQNLDASANAPFQLIIGGECCMLPAIMTAFWESASAKIPQQRVGLVYIDADTDLASPTDKDFTGIFAGTTMAHLVGLPGVLDSMAKFRQPSGEPVCDPSNTVLFGTNLSNTASVQACATYLHPRGYRIVDSSSVAEDPERCAREVLDFLEEQVDVNSIHLDVDSIDPRMFPLTNVPNFTGVHFEQMMRALDVMMRSKKVGGLCIAEVNPDHDPSLQLTERLFDEVVEMMNAR